MSNDGQRKPLDVQPWVDGPVCEPLGDRTCFARFFVGGGAVTGSNGADIAPETLYVLEGLLEEAAQTHAGQPGRGAGRVPRILSVSGSKRRSNRTVALVRRCCDRPALA
jgi:hypothetical protein